MKKSDKTRVSRSFNSRANPRTSFLVFSFLLSFVGCILPSSNSNLLVISAPQGIHAQNKNPSGTNNNTPLPTTTTQSPTPTTTPSSQILVPSEFSQLSFSQTGQHVFWGYDNLGKMPQQTLNLSSGQVIIKSALLHADAKAPYAWAIRTDCSAIPIAVVDSGVDPNHPDLASNLDLAKGKNFVPNTMLSSTDFHDTYFHGTHVSGIIGALANTNTKSAVGVCWRANIIPIKILTPPISDPADPTPPAANLLGNITNGIYYAKSVGAKIVNNSWELSRPTNGGQINISILDAAFLDLANSGVLLVNAAGNSSIVLDSQVSNLPFPNQFKHASSLTVGATDWSDSLAYFSNRSPLFVELAAPGFMILSTTPTTQTLMMQQSSNLSCMTTTGKISTNYECISGTSMAAPMVTGAAALVWAHNPNFTSIQVKSTLIQSAQSVPSLNPFVAGGKRLNIGRALGAQTP